LPKGIYRKIRGEKKEDLKMKGDKKESWKKSLQGGRKRLLVAAGGGES